MTPFFWRTAGFVLALGLSAPVAHAQSAKPAPAAPRAAIGTFQIIQLTDKVQAGLTSEALVEIERRRQPNAEVTWQFSPYARVRILPRAVITAPGFVPVPVQVNAK